MLDLPILNVRLSPCPYPQPPLSPTPQGHHCRSCNQEVIDFTQATQADLAAARAASPDGHLCGRFRAEQLASPPRLRPKLRRFLVALVLVCGLNLTSEQAWAQVRHFQHHGQCTNTPNVTFYSPADLNPVLLTANTEQPMAPVGPVPEPQVVFGGVMEQMPVFRGGEKRLRKLLAQNLRWPAEAKSIEGKVFVGFIVDKKGQVRNIRLLKGLHPALDAEALRVVQLLDGNFEPGQQNGRPVDVNYTIPVTFSLK